MKMKITIYIAIFLMLFVTSSNAQLGDLINKAKDAIQKKKDNKKVEEDKGTQSPKQNTSDVPNNSGSNVNILASGSELGTIYFSNQPFPPGGGTTGAKTSFNSNEFIYGRVVLNGTVNDVLKPNPPDEEIDHNYLIIYIEDSDGRILNSAAFFIILSPDELNKNYWDFDLLPAPDKIQTIMEMRGIHKKIWFNDFYNHLIGDAKEGNAKYTYKIRIRERDFRGNIKSNSSEIRGDFSFDFNGKDFNSIKANRDKVESNIENAQLNSVPVPEEWTLKSSPLLPGPTITAIKDSYFNWLGELETRHFLKIYVAPADSNQKFIVYNDLGIPKYRTLDQFLMIFMKDTEKNVCFYQGLFPIQYYSGGGTWGNYGSILSSTFSEIPCSKLGVK